MKKTLAKFHSCQLHPEEATRPNGIQAQVFVNKSGTVSLRFDGRCQFNQMKHEEVRVFGSVLLQAAQEAEDVSQFSDEDYAPGARVTYSHDDEMHGIESRMAKADFELMRQYDNCPGVVLEIIRADGYLDVEVFDGQGESMVISSWSYRAFALRDDDARGG